MNMDNQKLKIDSRLAQAGSRWDTRTGSVSMPIVPGSTFKHPGLGESTGFDYSRTANPTRQELERVLADLEGGVRALAFSSGMAAIDCALRLMEPGQTLLIPEDIYGGTFRLVEQLAKPWGLIIKWCDFEALRDNPAEAMLNVHAVLLETPTNPTVKTLDLDLVVKAAQKNDVLLMVDSTFLTPLLLRPLELGADVVIHSGSKYLAGHNDVISGVLAVKDEALAERLAFIQNTSGGVLGPFDSWLMLRGLKTLALRFNAAQKKAQIIAKWLQNRQGVVKVNYPGYGAMLSFSTDSHLRVKNLLEKVNLWIYAESLGGVESLITIPILQTHADMDAQVREKLGINDCLVRVSVGIEHADDLIADLDQALGE